MFLTTVNWKTIDWFDLVLYSARAFNLCFAFAEDFWGASRCGVSPRGVPGHQSQVRVVLAFPPSASILGNIVKLYRFFGCPVLLTRGSENLCPWVGIWGRRGGPKLFVLLLCNHIHSNVYMCSIFIYIYVCVYIYIYNYADLWFDSSLDMDYSPVLGYSDILPCWYSACMASTGESSMVTPFSRASQAWEKNMQKCTAMHSATDVAAAVPGALSIIVVMFYIRISSLSLPTDLLWIMLIHRSIACLLKYIEYINL